MEASSLRIPLSTLMPALRRRLIPFPLTKGLGSFKGITTRLMPASIMASVHGPVLPVWLQGSRVTYKVAPLVLPLAFLMASTSA